MSAFTFHNSANLQRGKQGSTNPGKIRGEHKYKDKAGVFRREDMGSVNVSLGLSKGELVVDLHSARNLAGRQSQDSYANVFLIDEENPKIPFKWNENQRVIFEEGHKKTKVFKQNLNPDFQEKFVFKTDSNILKDITKTSLVISIWDKDTKTRDDYMAGITVPLKYVDKFKKLDDVVEIKLHVQEMDGYVSLTSFHNVIILNFLLQPKRLSDGEVVELFGPIRHDGWDLKECNNRLVTYIDKARVLRC